MFSERGKQTIYGSQNFKTGLGTHVMQEKSFHGFARHAGTLPAEWGSLSQLQYLYMGYNSLSGENFR